MFIPRHPVIENQFCSYIETNSTTGAGGTIAYAGAVVALYEWDSVNGRAKVKVWDSTASGNGEVPYGFLMQKVKEGYTAIHPANYMLPKDMGSSDAIAAPVYNSSTGAISGTKATPVGVAHLGVWETTNYLKIPVQIFPGDKMYVSMTEGRITNTTVSGFGDSANTVAVAESFLNPSEVATGTKALRIKLLI